MKDWPPELYELQRERDAAQAEEDALFERLRGGEDVWPEYDAARSEASDLYNRIMDIVMDPARLIDRPVASPSSESEGELRGSSSPPPPR